MADEPTGIEGVSEEFLTTVLRGSGLLSQDATVNGFHVSRPAAGFAGGVYRLALTCSSLGAPTSIIAKFASGDSVGLQRYPTKIPTEAGFYSELGERSGLSVPRVLYLHHDPARAEFCLIMEDIGNPRDSALADPYSREEWTLLFTKIAEMHGLWWESAGLGALPWLGTFEAYVRDRQRLLPGLMESFLPRWSARLSPELHTLFNELEGLMAALGHRLEQRPITLVHTDLNFGNVIFAPQQDGLKLGVIDWQDVVRGPAAVDVAIPLNLVRPEDRPQAQELYRSVLKARCGYDYSAEQLDADVTAWSLYSAFVAVGRGAIGSAAQDQVCERLIATRQADWIAAQAILRTSA